MRTLTKALSLTAAAFLLLAGSALAAPKDTLVIGQTYSPKTFDPQATPDAGTHNYCKQAYEGLLDRDLDNNIVGVLAEKWEILDEGKTFKFSLKKGVKFHNGETMTADDVVFTFTRAIGPAGAGIKALAMYIDPAGIEKVDDHTVIIRTTLPIGNKFIESLTHPWASILNKKAVEEMGKDYGVQPVGTGRFAMANWKSGDHVEFVRFKDYHGTPAKLEKIIMRVIVEAASRTIELESGAVDVIIDPARVDMKRIEESKHLKVVTMPGVRMYYLSFDVTHKPYDDIRVRQAMNLAANRLGICKVVFRGYADPGKGVITSAIKYNRDKETPLVEMDIPKAKQLLAEAGFPNGFKGKMIVPDRTEVMATATVLQNNFKAIGIDMEIGIYEYGAFMEAIRKQGHDPFVNPWWGGEPAQDPFFVMTPPFHSSVIGQTNRSFFKDEQIDKWFDEGATLPDGPERATVYAQLWDRLNELLPWLNIAAPNAMYGVNKKLQGVTFQPGSINYYGYASFSD